MDLSLRVHFTGSSLARSPRWVSSLLRVSARFRQISSKTQAFGAPQNMQTCHSFRIGSVPVCKPCVKVLNVAPRYEQTL